MTTATLKPNKQILFVHQGFELYGSDKVLLLNIKAAAEKYPEKKIVVVLPQKGALSEVLEKEFKVAILIKKLGVLRKYDLKRFDFSSFLRIFTFFRLIGFLNPFDLVYINSMVVVDYILAARFCKPVSFIHVHELPTGFSRRVFSKLLNFSKASLVFVSAASKNAFYGLRNQTQVVLWNGCQPIPESKSADPQKDKINILLIGRINSWKGQPLLVNALSYLSSEEKEKLRVRIVGDVFADQQKLKTNLTNLVGKYSLQNIVEILPFTSQPEYHYNWANVVVVPSLLPEPFGLVAIEAMSLGKLVIAAAHGGLTEIISDQDTGMLFKPGDAANLAEKIRAVVQNPSIIALLGDSGRKLYEKNFTERIYIENYKRIVLEAEKT